MKKDRIFYFSLILILACLANFSYAETPLIELKASLLPAGETGEWLNQGRLGGKFICFSGYLKTEVVAGRRAVTFNGKDQILKLKLNAAGAITTRNAFSVSLWVFAPEIDRKMIILCWPSSSGTDTAFALGRAYDGAFSQNTAKRLGYEGGIPSSATWHHLTFTYDGIRLRVYVDGELNTEKTMQLKTGEEQEIYLGGGFRAERNSFYNLFLGSIAEVDIYDRVLSAPEIRHALGFFSTFDPSPRNKETIKTLEPCLKWEKGDDNIASFAVYFGEDKDSIQQSRKDLSSYKGLTTSGENFFGPVKVLPGRTYFWKVDELDSAGKVKHRGEVWSFGVDAGEATCPFPRHQMAGVKKSLIELKWVPGEWAVSQNIYFDTSLAKVEAGETSRISKLGPEISCCHLPLPLEYGVTYYWRVETDNGSLPSARGKIWSFRVEDREVKDDLTFYLVSDTHYGASLTINSANQTTIDIMNGLPGTKFPAEAGGGLVRTPRGVLVLGDLVDEGGAEDAPHFWQQFVADYGLNGEGRLAFPVYEGVGNHDGGQEDYIRWQVRGRNLQRKRQAGIYTTGLHYSWDWENVHFVHLNLYPGSGGEDIINPWGTYFEGSWKYPEHSLEFLIDDLDKNVGKSGRPVVIIQHYGFDDWSKGWWSENERVLFYKAIKNYNVIAIFWGHSHLSQFISWKGINTWCVGSGQQDPEPGQFFVVNINPKEMIVAERKKDGWGLVMKSAINNALHRTGEKTPELIRIASYCFQHSNLTD